ncbi:MAG: glycosyltransferase, partial [Candidatus Korarchaeota archaeon]|nr:glycosyltransferase [Candidatus Korarchaeota archaeon]NIU84395.1 glycosyltransferase [Candidatus Thorarchaeota archaeon]NIW14503.1 glycosyltransferase [Candidatus Thorarchaeota archaeon]NIW52583.1 glycosyltransferase [Candidatus Korarchaeota archaeon]
MNTIQRSPTPLITIGMLTKNRSWCLPQVLARMEEMDYPKEQIKIVFVDGNSTDDTFSMLRKWKEREETEYHDILLIQKECNIPEGRNICIRQMEGDYLIFWDSDVIPAKDFIRILIKHFHMNERLGMIGADYTYENDELKTVLRNIKTHALYMGFTAIK